MGRKEKKAREGGPEAEGGKPRRKREREVRRQRGVNLFHVHVHVHVHAQVKSSSLYWDNLSVDTELNSLSSSMYAQVCSSQ